MTGCDNCYTCARYGCDGDHCVTTDKAVNDLIKVNRQLTNEARDLRAGCALYMERIRLATEFLTGTNNRDGFNRVNIAANAVLALTDEERLDLFTDYCRGCGTANLPCHCQDDE